MPKRTDIKSVLIIGAGPIVIGQACEFDYSGVQACRALKEEGLRVILVNSNPATIMTDPSLADATYIEPVNWQTIAKIIEKERPDALLPTMGGQTALNCALDLAHNGVLEKFSVEMIGANELAINKAEDRDLFKQAMSAIGLESPRSYIAHTLDESFAAAEQLGFPCIIRPSFTLGGSGGGIAYNREEFQTICEHGLDISPTNELLIDESLLGWKEYEMEVVRDKNDNCIIVCAIENIDPMGVHTGDSITVAPAQTLTDKEYQLMRNASIAVLREIGVETGGSNVQFGINPDNGRMVVIEMNPRVSRSSALASKATGFPIAKIAAKLAIGYTLDELQNDITGGRTPASFEPTIDYVITKIPRFNFEKFPAANDVLSTQMKAVGEIMAIGRNFQESFQKALRSLEIDSYGFESKLDLNDSDIQQQITQALAVPRPERIWLVADAFRAGLNIDDVFALTKIDRWYLVQIQDLVQEEQIVMQDGLQGLNKERLYRLKRKGFSDYRLAQLTNTSESKIRARRHKLKIHPIYKRVDTCAAEFATNTAYLYSSYDEQCEAQPTERDKIMVLGGGPNRIGQGIEFDYCCVHASFAMRSQGYETIMVNCNPETVSTDYDISDRLYFEPITLEDVLEIYAVEKPKGVIVQYGGQTPLKLVNDLQAAGVPIIGTSPDAIDMAEDRERFQAMLKKLGLLQPANATVRTSKKAKEAAQEINYPLVVRPSYVLGGRAMEIIYDDAELDAYMQKAEAVYSKSPLLLDHFLDDSIEVDVDAVCDGELVVIGGIMQHIEQAGVHSGDSACSLPPYSLSKKIQDDIRQQTKAMALELGVIGLMNVQFAVKNDEVYVLEVNPRASRTVPFVSKAIGVSLAQIAANCMVGKSLAEQGFTKEIKPLYYYVKEAVFPFVKFPEVDPILGPEMKSTGEVMGIGETFAEAFGKAAQSAGENYPKSGTVFVSVKDADKPAVVEVAQCLLSLGFDLIATEGTYKTIAGAGLQVEQISKINESRPNIVDMLKNQQIQMVINTVAGKQATKDSSIIRRLALQSKISYTTTIAAAKAVCQSMQHTGETKVRSLQ